jgi:ribosome recycling factor
MHLTTSKDILKNADDRMKKAVEVVRDELVRIRTGKATTALLDGVKVDYYGTMTPLNQVANVSTPDVHTISVQPWEKNMVGPIEKAILAANLGFNPASDGAVIRVPIPPLNEERRKELVKLVKKFGEDGKVAIRNIRRDAIEHLKKAEKETHMPEDERKRSEQEAQKLTDKHIKDIDTLLGMKEKEIMEV